MSTSLSPVDLVFANQVSWLRNINNAGLPRPAGFGENPPGSVVFAATHLVTMASTKHELSEAISTLRRHDQSGILAWTARPDPDADQRLHARGFRESFAPTWMWHDLREVPAIPGHETDVAIRQATPGDRAAYLAAPGVPYVNQETSGGVLDRILGNHPRSLMLFAWSGETVIGTGALHVTMSHDGAVGGIYNVAVATSWRRRGIATAITTRLLHLAREWDAFGACLNATPEGLPVYRGVGFRVAGHGQTWFMPAGRTLPGAGATAAAEALAQGDVAGLDPEIARLETMPNGESPVRFAARYGQDAAIQWLLDHGAHPDIHTLWSRGFRREAERAMADHGLRDRLWGIPGASALHEAVRTGDDALVDALLEAGADRTVRDGEWKATPQEWARVLRRNRLASILEAPGDPGERAATD